MASAFAALIAGMGWRIWHECPTIEEHLISGGHRLVSDGNEIFKSRASEGGRFKSEEEVREYCKLALERKRFLIPYWSMEEYKDYCTLSMGEVLSKELGEIKIQKNKIAHNRELMEKYIKNFDTKKYYWQQLNLLQNWCQANFKIHYAQINTLTEILMREWCYETINKNIKRS